MPCLPSFALSPTPESIRSCGVWNAPADTITSRRARICLSSLPCRYATPTARFASKRLRVAGAQDAGGMSMGLDAQIGSACHMRVDIGACGAAAFAVLLRQLIDAEALMFVGIEILAQAELRFLRSLQEDLLHRIAGARLVDGERSALAMIFAVEVRIVFRALEIGQHVGERPAGVAERSPLIVVGAVAADIDHRVDRRRAAESLAAGLIAGAAVEALLRDGIEGPVVDVACDHQHERERRRHHPIVVPAAGIQK